MYRAVGEGGGTVACVLVTVWVAASGGFRACDLARRTTFWKLKHNLLGEGGTVTSVLVAVWVAASGGFRLGPCKADAVWKTGTQPVTTRCLWKAVPHSRAAGAYRMALLV